MKPQDAALNVKTPRRSFVSLELRLPPSRPTEASTKQWEGLQGWEETLQVRRLKFSSESSFFVNASGYTKHMFLNPDIVLTCLAQPHRTFYQGKFLINNLMEELYFFQRNLLKSTLLFPRNLGRLSSWFYTLTAHLVNQIFPPLYTREIFPFESVPEKWSLGSNSGQMKQLSVLQTP